MTSVFLDTYFDNASPLRWRPTSENTIEIDLAPDHERFSPNRQTTHWHFRIHVPGDEMGKQLKLRLRTIFSCWNGHEVPALGKTELTTTISTDGKTWKSLPLELDEEDISSRYLTLSLDAPCIHIAHLEPYTEANLKQTLEKFADHPHLSLYNIGTSVEGRPLEMLEIGSNPNAPTVLFRARAHPWETGGSWLLEGLMRFALAETRAAATFRDNIRLCLMPMANKDGVARGMARFNIRGIDLNRGWTLATPQDPVLCPENACLESWLAARCRENRAPKLAIDLHNDNGGNLHVSHPLVDNGYAQRMERFETLLRKHTWFTEGATAGSFRNPGTFGEGLIEIFGIDALILELRSPWADGIDKTPLAEDWKEFGRGFAEVLSEYFSV